jgi:uncharacterized protein (DUF1778 family)
MTAVERLRLVLDTEDKDLLSHAANLTGTTLAGFVRSAAKERALSLLEKEVRVTMSRGDLVEFQTAIAGAFAPNAAMQKAIRVAAKVKRG